MPPRPTRSIQKLSLLSDDEGLVRKTDILKVYPVGKSSWDRGVREGRYPRPVKLSPRVNAWRVRDIRKLLE